jgi:hypothetical protein
MKFGIINFSGNVGKSLIAHMLLQPRLNCSVLSIESINSDDVNGQGEKLKAEQFLEVQQELLINDALIVDIGASNVEQVMAMFKAYNNSHEDYDFFIVPILKEMKIQQDSISTIKALLDLGISASKIKVIFNDIELNDDLGSAFKSCLKYLNDNNIEFSETPVFHTKLFTELEKYNIKTNIKELVKMTKNKDQIKASIPSMKTQEEKREAAAVIGALRMTETFMNELDDAYQGLMDIVKPEKKIEPASAGKKIKSEVV